MAPLPKIYRKEDIETLRRLYLDDKLSTTEISDISPEKFGQKISDSGIYSALIRNKIPLRSIGDSVSMAMSTLDISKSFLTENKLEWIDGFNLGDGYIGFNKERRDCRGARFHFGSINKEWTEYAMSGLREYKPSEAHEIGNIDKKHPRLTWASSTLTHPDIVAQAKRWYPNGKKIVPVDVRITPVSLLLWYLGDGSISKMGITFFIRLATCGFAPQDIDNILIPRLTEMGLVATRDVSKNDIRISSVSVGLFFKIIGKKSPIACYSYKFEYGDWLNLYRLSDVAKDEKEKWRIQYLFKQGKLDCSTSPGGKLIMFTEAQKNKIRAILDGHVAGEEYAPAIHTVVPKETIKLSDLINNDIERWNARYLITRKVIQSNKSMLTQDQANLLRLKLDEYGSNSAIPQYMIDSAFRQYRDIGFPFYRFTNEVITKKVNQIANFSPVMQDGTFKWNGFGTEVANYFHPQMFECKKKGKMSPIEFFSSDDDFKRGIKKVIALYPEINISNIREICCNETASSRINNFPPRVMMSVLHHLYYGQKITMLDPCAGFSGRLIGSYASNIVKKYVGMDLSEPTYNGLLATKDFLNTLSSEFQSDILHGNCLQLMQSYPHEVDFVFTSPPFLDEEKYMNVPVETDYFKWKTDFIEPFIVGTYKVLKSGGKMAVYTEAIRRNDFPFDFEQISLSVGYKKIEDIWFSMPCRENIRKERTTRKVKMIVFQKDT